MAFVLILNKFNRYETKHDFYKITQIHEPAVNDRMGVKIKIMRVLYDLSVKKLNILVWKT